MTLKMAKPTRNQIAQFRAYQRRQARYEKQYTKLFYAYLRKCYYSSARLIQKEGIQADYRATFDDTKLERIFRQLYKNITLEEAKIAYKEMILPYESANRLQAKVSGEEIEKKDIIDDLAEILSGNNSNLIRVWRSLLDEFIEVRLTGRISRINQVTQERIAKIIEQGIFDGLGQEDLARLIRRQARESSINVVRSRAIARTETVVSANQGKYMSAKSSNLVMQKKWLPTIDARTRDGGPGREANHRIMFDKDWQPLEEDFRVPNALGVEEMALYPGDPRLSAGNVINCRCSLVVQPVRDSNGSLIRKR